MPDNKLTVSFEYRYKVIMEVVSENAIIDEFGKGTGAQEDEGELEEINLSAMRIIDRGYVYWFILTGATGLQFIYKCVYKEKQ